VETITHQVRSYFLLGPRPQISDDVRLVDISSPPSCPNYTTTNCSQHIQRIQEVNNFYNGRHSGAPLCHRGKSSRAAVTSAGSVCCQGLRLLGSVCVGWNGVIEGLGFERQARLNWTRSFILHCSDLVLVFEKLEDPAQSTNSIFRACTTLILCDASYQVLTNYPSPVFTQCGEYGCISFPPQGHWFRRLETLLTCTQCLP
jgi:hypothetical protein